MGNVVNAITKSGTRSFHGTLFEFVRNNNLDANNFFNNRNVWCGRSLSAISLASTWAVRFISPNSTGSGQTSIFGAYEGLRQQTPTTLITSVPTAEDEMATSPVFSIRTARRALIFDIFTTRLVNGSYVRDPFAGNVLPRQMLDSVALKLLPYWPQPNRPGDPRTSQNNFAGTARVAH